jgi:hypothetical protein
MAKKKPQDDDRVLVIAAAGFRYEGKLCRTGDPVRMTPEDAADMLALHMVRRPTVEAAA